MFGHPLCLDMFGWPPLCFDAPYAQMPPICFMPPICLDTPVSLDTLICLDAHMCGLPPYV